jgi:dipeptidyl aminopeptidase/acylaminoacyl peptidase
MLRHSLKILVALAAGAGAPLQAASTTAVDPAMRAAYDHPLIASEATSRPLVVSPDGGSIVYSLIVSSNPDSVQEQFFLANGTPDTADGVRLHLVRPGRKGAQAICPAAGNDWDPSWSPDGRSVAFYSDRSGGPRLWLFDVATGACRQLGEVPIKSLVFPFEQPRWSADGRTIYVPGWPATGPGSMAVAAVPTEVGGPPRADASGVTIFSHPPRGTPADAAPGEDFESRCASGVITAASLFAVGVADGAARLLVDQAVESAADKGAARHYPSPYLRVSPSGRWISYVAGACRKQGDRFETAMDLYVVPAAGGAPRLVQAGLRTPGGGGEFDYGYRWHPLRDELVLIKDTTLWQVDLTGGEVAAARPVAPEVRGIAPHILRYVDGGRAVIVGLADEKSARSVLSLDSELMFVPLDGAPARRIAFDRTRWSARSLPATADDAAWQSGATSVHVQAADKATGGSAMLSLDWVSGASRLLWHENARVGTVIPATGGAVAVHENFALPPDVVRFSADWKRLERISHVAPGLDGLKAGSIERFETVIPFKDGSLRRVGSTVILPPGSKRGDKLPAVVWFYPARNMNPIANQYGAPAMGDLAHLVTARGYAVLLLEIPLGPDGEAGDPVDEIVDAMMPQIHHAAALGYVDPARIALRGQSFGGYATAAVVTRTNLFRAAIPSSGTYDLGGSYGSGEILRGQLLDNSRWSEKGQARMGAPLWSDPMRYLDNSPYYHADRIHTPMLIIQGTSDPVGYRESRKLYAALRRLDREVELVMYDGGGHSPPHWRSAHAIDQMMRTLDFMDKHLGKPGK